MKKLLALLLAGAMALSLVACGGSEPAAPEGGEAEAATGKVAIVTNTVSQNEEEYRSAEQMAEKYGDTLIGLGKKSGRKQE